MLGCGFVCGLIGEFLVFWRGNAEGVLNKGNKGVSLEEQDSRGNGVGFSIFYST